LCQLFKYFIKSLKKIIFYLHLIHLHSFKHLKAKSKQRIAIFEFIIVLIVFVASEVVNNNVNFKTKTISAKLKINYRFVLRYDCAFKQDFDLNNRRELLKSIFR